jgi:nucleotide-binding universal stress UspA family protein
MRIAVGIDLRTTGHSWLVERAGAWARALGGIVDLVYFHNGGDDSVHKERLDVLLATLGPAQRGHTLVESAASPDEGLVRLTRSHDLLVVGSREPAALERWLKGPMATRVLRGAEAPVLVPRREAPPPERPRLLVGVDVTEPETAQVVLHLAADWAVRLGGTLEALYAVTRALPPIQDKAVREKAEREWTARNERERQRLEKLLADNVPKAHRGRARIGRGEPDDALIAASHDVDLVMVGNRDREGLAQLVLGTVAQRVVRQAHSDVLSLPTAFVLGES